jgi:hypothetical protein
MTFMVLGQGQSLTALSLTRSMHSSPSKMIMPRYSTNVLLKEHFSGRKKRSRSSNHWSTSWVSCPNFTRLLKKMSMLSK